MPRYDPKKSNLNRLNYKKARLRTMPLKGEPGKLPPGIWLPVSSAASYASCSMQTIRLLFLLGRIKGLKFEKGPLLVDITFLGSHLKRTGFAYRQGWQATPTK
jgi:hypothetical protein